MVTGEDITLLGIDKMLGDMCGGVWAIDIPAITVTSEIQECSWISVLVELVVNGTGDIWSPAECFCVYDLYNACCECTDTDGDGYYIQSGCGTSVDCDDNNAAVNPGACESCANCDGIDNDCDGQIDEECTPCTDADGDGFCADNDCNDNDPSIHEGCGGGVPDLPAAEAELVGQRPQVYLGAARRMAVQRGHP